MRYRLGLGLAIALLALAVVPAMAGDDVTMDGEFVWQRSDGEHSGALKAIFTPTGEGEWSVAFHFEWEDGPHVYSGTAKGSLTQGSLEGRVDNDNEEHPASFLFTGKFDGGSFSGTHAHIDKEGKENSTGTLTLKAAG